jgi:hypothetical protein
LTDYHSSTSSTVNNSPRNSIAQLNANASDSEVSNEVFNNGLSTDIMLSGISGSGPNDYVFGNESVGPPEAFYPFVSISSNGNMGIVDEDEDGSSSVVPTSKFSSTSTSTSVSGRGTIESTVCGSLDCNK